MKLGRFVQMRVTITRTNPIQICKYKISMISVQFSSVQSLSRVWLFATPWIAARQVSPSITNSRSLLKPMSIESVMPSNHLILCRPLLLRPFNLSQHQGLFQRVSGPLWAVSNSSSTQFCLRLPSNKERRLSCPPTLKNHGAFHGFNV